MNNEKQIIDKLSEHDGRFDRHDKRFDRTETHLDKHDTQFKAVIDKLLSHDTRFEALENKVDAKFSELSNQYLTGQDQITTSLKRIEQELVANTHASRRHQDILDEHGKDIKTIKPSRDLMVGVWACNTSGVSGTR